MNNSISVTDFAKLYAETETAKVALANMKANDKYNCWQDKTELDFALWCFSVYNGKTVYEEACFFETDVCWYPAFEIGNKSYVKATLFKHTSNLDLYTIRLAGDDDYSISKDLIGYEEAIRNWLDLHAEKYVRPEHLKDHYFSN